MTQALPIYDYRLKSMSQELGTVVSDGEELDFKRFPIGSFLKIIPFHVSIKVISLTKTEHK